MRRHTADSCSRRHRPLSIISFLDDDAVSPSDAVTPDRHASPMSPPPSRLALAAAAHDTSLLPLWPASTPADPPRHAAQIARSEPSICSGPCCVRPPALAASPSANTNHRTRPSLLPPMLFDGACHGPAFGSDPNEHSLALRPFTSPHHHQPLRNPFAAPPHDLRAAPPPQSPACCTAAAGCCTRSEPLMLQQPHFPACDDDLPRSSGLDADLEHAAAALTAVSARGSASPLLAAAPSRKRNSLCIKLESGADADDAAQQPPRRRMRSDSFVKTSPSANFAVPLPSALDMSFDVSDSCAGADMADVKQSPAPRLAASNAASGEGEERIVPPLILENGKFGCPECDKSYHRQCDYRSHYRVHDSKRPFECSICAQSFLRRHDLNRHTRIHSGAKPFKCFRCGKGFVRKDALRRHLNMDPNVQRFRCSLRAAPSVDMADYAGINGDDDDAGESASLSNGSEDSD